MNNFKNMSKKKSFCNALFNEFFGSILLVLFITYMAAFIILGKQQYRILWRRRGFHRKRHTGFQKQRRII